MPTSNKASNFTHLNAQGEANMVDVSDKGETARAAIAQSSILLTQNIVDAIANHTSTNNLLTKGDLFATIRIAGIQAAKRCSDLIPLCHPLPLSKVAVEIELIEQSLKITATCKTTGKTGVEMEALTAVSVAALTAYDMCKGIDKGMIIQETKLLEKTGGKSGNWLAK